MDTRSDNALSGPAKRGREICCAAEPGNLPNRANASGVFYIDLSIVAPLYFADMGAATVPIHSAHVAVDFINKISGARQELVKKYTKGFDRLDDILSLSEPDHPDLKKLPLYQKDKSQTLRRLQHSALSFTWQNRNDLEDGLSDIVADSLSFLDSPLDSAYLERLETIASALQSIRKAVSKTAIDAHRKKDENRKDRRLKEYEKSKELEFGTKYDAPKNSPLETVSDISVLREVEHVSDIQKWIEALECPIDKEISRLKFLARRDITERELADKLNIPKSTVHDRLARLKPPK